MKPSFNGRKRMGRVQAPRIVRTGKKPAVAAVDDGWRREGFKLLAGVDKFLRQHELLGPTERDALDTLESTITGKQRKAA